MTKAFCLWLIRDAVKSVDKVAWVKRYYARDAETLADFINDWGYTIDPRLVGEGKNPVMAFALFPRQREMIAWMIGCLQDRKPGVVVKSRDVGASWVAMALLATLCIFRQGFAAGVGSAVEIKIDRTGDAAVQSEREAALRASYPGCIVISARRPEDVLALRESLVGFFGKRLVDAELFLPWSDQQLRGEIFAHCEVLEERADSQGATLRIRGEPELVQRLQDRLSAAAARA